MEALVIIAIFVVVLWIIFRPKKTRRVSASASSEAIEPHALESEEGRRADFGPVTAAEGGGWILNPRSPFPLTVENCSEEIAEKLARALRRCLNDWGQAPQAVAYFLAQHNIRCREIETMMSQLRALFEKEVHRLIGSSSEWASAGEKDREDLRLEFEETALETLPIGIPNFDLVEYMQSEPSDATADDALVAHFGGDSEALGIFVAQLGSRSRLAVIPADHYWRKPWERLVEKGLARRGANVAPALVLETLTLKEMSEVASGLIEKPFTRKAKGIEFLRRLPDLRERLSRTVGLREVFELTPPAGIDVDAITRCHRHAYFTADLLVRTYRQGADTLRTLADAAEYRRGGVPIQGWAISQFEEPLPPCARKHVKESKRRPVQLPPFHPGCTCELEHR